MEHHIEFTKRMFDASNVNTQFSTFWGVVFSIITTVTVYASSFANNILGISLWLFVLLFIIMIGDFASGVAASRRERKKFTSKKGLSWVIKLALYTIVVNLTHGMKAEAAMQGLGFLTYPFVLIHFTVIWFIIYWELKSVDENMERLGWSFRILKLFESIFTVVIDLIKPQMKR